MVGSEEVLTEPCFRGRGCVSEKDSKVGPRQYSPAGDLVDSNLFAALKIIRLLDEILEKDRPEAEGRYARELPALWGKICRLGCNELNCNKFNGDWNIQELPDHMTMTLLRGRLGRHVSGRGVALRRKRVREYENRKRAELRVDPTRAFEHIKPDRDPVLSVLRRPDGSFTGNLNEIDEMLREAWLPIFAKHTEANPEPDAKAFIDKYTDHIPVYEQYLNPISLDDLKSTIRKLKASGAAGLDNWKPGEIKKLPDEILEFLLPFYELIEINGEWPLELTWAAVTLIPKGEGSLPLSQRPISVMSIVYRIWAATRARQCLTWQEYWIHKGQHGCRPKHSTSDALARISVTMESAMLNGEELVGAAVDFAKAFDNVPTAIGLAILRRMGLDVRVLAPLTTMYASLKRRFKIKGFLGKMFRATNGIMQGDPLSCMVFERGR